MEIQKIENFNLFRKNVFDNFGGVVVVWRWSHTNRNNIRNCIINAGADCFEIIVLLLLATLFCLHHITVRNLQFLIMYYFHTE